MWVTVKYQCISLQFIWCYDICGRWGCWARGWVEKRALTFMPMYKHPSSHIAHFMRYNRRKWKPLIGWNRLAQCHRVLNKLTDFSPSGFCFEVLLLPWIASGQVWIFVLLSGATWASSRPPLTFSVRFLSELISSDEAASEIDCYWHKFRYFWCEMFFDLTYILVIDIG